MRRAIAVVACLSVLMVAGANSALAKGPHHGGYGKHHRYQANYFGGKSWNNFRGPSCAPQYCGPRPRVAAYPVYPVYPVAPAYPRLGFGLGGSNFSFWYQQ
jgi:hypothetical protein